MDRSSMESVLNDLVKYKKGVKFNDGHIYIVRIEDGSICFTKYIEKDDCFENGLTTDDVIAYEDYTETKRSTQCLSS